VPPDTIPTLGNALEEVGPVMALRTYSIFVLILLPVMLAVGFGCAAPSAPKADLKDSTVKIQAGLQSGMNALDMDLSRAAASLSVTGLSGSEARKVLSDLCTKYPYLIDCVTADTAGKMVTVAPETYRKYEGAYIGTENIKTPVLSGVMRATEGMDAAALMWPVIDKGGVIGVISALFKPSTVLDSVAGLLIKETGVELNVTQLDGLVIYDSSGRDTGKNFLTDPSLQSYKDLVELNKAIAAKESGSGSYNYPSSKNGELVNKQAVWASMKLHNSAWRLICVAE
jgi:hypothetical protein